MEFEYLLRILIAGLCGALIGYERKSRMKEAGIRTHFVVAVGASLMMVISKYAFQDQTNWDKLVLDPSRIAAQVVSGVGFLGAGMIFMQKQTVKGLTTAAGIWATAGTGMAVGAGLYIVGAGVTIIILFAQILLHGKITRLVSPKTEQLTLYLNDEKDAITRIKSLFHENNIFMISFVAKQSQSSENKSEISIEALVKLTGSQNIDQFLSLIQEESSVRSVEVH
ncbi:MgtC/SapB family protein [Cohnella cellulosilytica]|uniref:MgtC/SapB family protein n=1 Tax=Cohnella cellulosilytica TaxID=986710 RepID=A0ABW2FJA1_9BACL